MARSANNFFINFSFKLGVEYHIWESLIVYMLIYGYTNI